MNCRANSSAQVVNVMRAAWKMTDADEGMKRLEGLARFLEHDYESAARSLREGMAEMFTDAKAASFRLRSTNAWARPTSSRARKAAFRREPVM